MQALNYDRNRNFNNSYGKLGHWSSRKRQSTVVSNSIELMLSEKQQLVIVLDELMINF